MTCPTCDRPLCTDTSPATYGPGESCECGLRISEVDDTQEGDKS